MVASLARQGRDACVFLIVSVETLSAKILDILGQKGNTIQDNKGRHFLNTLWTHYWIDTGMSVLSSVHLC